MNGRKLVSIEKKGNWYKDKVRTDATFLHNLTALFRDIILILTIIYFIKYKIEVGIVFLFIRYTLDVSDVTRLTVYHGIQKR